MSRRQLLHSGAALGLLGGVESLTPRYAKASPATGPLEGLQGRLVDGRSVFDLEIAETPLEIAGRRTTATTINGTIPGPLLHLREGQQTVVRVTNRLKEDTSIHWHGILVPPQMDGVPGVSFPGIRPGQTFEYSFPLHQYGTYWYHSHSGLQEQLGHYGPLIVHPAEGRHPYRYDREYVVLLSDWTFENPYRLLAKLKKDPDYYNFQKRTIFDFFSDVASKGFLPTTRDRLMWARMRMNPTDISDVTGATYTFLMNGLAPESNWTGLFHKGERVLLHVINASANTFFDVRVPGLPMTVVQASGQYVQPVETDEFRIAVAETFDVIVQPNDDRPYTVFAEAMDRSGYARGTLAPRRGMSAAIPLRRKRPVLTMADMGMEHGEKAGGMKDMDDVAPATQDHAGHHVPTGHAPGVSKQLAGKPLSTGAAGIRYASAGRVRTQALDPPGAIPGMLAHDRDTHGPGNAAVPMMVMSRLAEPGIGLGDDGWRVLRYTDLRALERRPDFRAPTREIELHLTGNMERFMWSLDGVPFSESKPLRLAHNERIRLTMVNDTMMNHPMHLHGMWMELENGHRESIPRVHTVSVKPAERLSLLITADTPGSWAFHCHLLYHMEVGMFRLVEVSKPGQPEPVARHHHEG